MLANPSLDCVLIKLYSYIIYIYIMHYIIFLSFILNTLQSSLFNRVVLGRASQSLCLDGTPGAYYISDGSGVNNTKFIIWFEGGGWCGGQDLASTLEDCYQRSSTDLGSSKNYPATMNLNASGILSGDASINPSYYDWNRIILKYCDGTGHQGTKSLPINYKGKDIYFRGKNITLGQLTGLNFSHRLFTQATQILVTGASAGGLAAYQWVNWISDNSNAKVWVFPDSGIFLDVINVYSNKFEYRNKLINFMKISNIQVNPPLDECNSKYPNQIWKCMFAQNLHQHIRVPLFSINPLYDSWSIPNILGINCISDRSLKNCNSSEKNYIQQYRTNTTNVLNLIIKKNENGIWAPACAGHTYIDTQNWNSNNYRVPANSIYSIENSVTNWIQNSKQSSKNIHIDDVKWPENSPCAGVTFLQRE